jgi:hypothetical protein
VRPFLVGAGIVIAVLYFPWIAIIAAILYLWHQGR